MLSVGNSLAVQWLGLGTFTAEGLGSISGRRSKIPQAAWRGQKENKINAQCCLKKKKGVTYFNLDINC